MPFRRCLPFGARFLKTITACILWVFCLNEKEALSEVWFPSMETIIFGFICVIRALDALCYYVWLDWNSFGEPVWLFEIYPRAVCVAGLVCSCCWVLFRNPWVVESELKSCLGDFRELEGCASTWVGFVGKSVVDLRGLEALGFWLVYWVLRCRLMVLELLWWNWLNGLDWELAWKAHIVFGSLSSDEGCRELIFKGLGRTTGLAGPDRPIGSAVSPRPFPFSLDLDSQLAQFNNGYQTPSSLHL